MRMTCGRRKKGNESQVLERTIGIFLRTRTENRIERIELRNLIELIHGELKRLARVNEVKVVLEAQLFVL